MPEGPEVRLHAERMNLRCAGRMLCAAEILSGRYLPANRPGGSVPGRGAPPANWAKLERALPAPVRAVRSKGKFMWLELGGATPLTLWSTLGMTGGWSSEPGAHARLRIELCDAAGAAEELFFHDQRNFGTVTVCMDDEQLATKLASLGPSWLDLKGLSRDDFGARVAAQCGTKRRAQVAVAKWLMDQTKTAGIGNYILSETLFAAEVWPWARVGDLDKEAWDAIYEAATDVVGRSYTSQAALAEQQGGLSATRGTTWSFELRAYRQEQTPCGERIVKSEGPHGRAVFWSPTLQTRGWRPKDDF